MEQLLAIRDLRVWFNVRIGLLAGFAGQEARHVRAVDGISLDISRGEVFCLVGESGCGKTTTGKALLRLNDPTSGNMLYRIPPDEFDRLERIEARLRDVEAAIGAGVVPIVPGIGRLWDRLQDSKQRLMELVYPWTTVSGQLRIEQLQRTIRILEERRLALQSRSDLMLKRILAKDRERLDLVKEMGPDVPTRTAARLEKLGRDLRDAQYLRRRAEAKGMGVWRAKRIERKIERRRKRIRSKIDASAKASPEEINTLQKALEEKESNLAASELGQVEASLAHAQSELALLRGEQPGLNEAVRPEVARLEQETARIREQGGMQLEAKELRSLRDEIIGRYDLSKWSPEQTKELRKRMQIIYQDPYESLNPKMSIFDIVAEPLLANHIVGPQAEAEAVVRKALEDVGLKPAEEYMFRYPHELSGGQRQRVGIAAALVVDPEFIVADEPVSMLDASVRTEILALLLDLKKERNLTYLFVTHDLGLAWIIADRVAVMYLGKIVEMGDGPEIIQNPRHPYTKALISVVPSPNPGVHREKIILKGERPNAVDIPPGCRFHPRCPMAIGICGWDADEVKAELLRLFGESAGDLAGVGVSDVLVDEPFALHVSTSDPQGLERFLRNKVTTLGGSRPALGAIRGIEATPGAVALRLHVPTEPPLQQIREKVWVACHLVEPEAATEATAAPAITETQIRPSTTAMA